MSARDDLRDDIANVLQCRMSWLTAEACASDVVACRPVDNLLRLASIGAWVEEFDREHPALRGTFWPIVEALSAGEHGAAVKP